MKSESWKIMLACAIGAGIGSFLALELVSYLWWLGLVVGGLTGYLSYEWREVLGAARTTTRKMVSRKVINTARFAMAFYCYVFQILSYFIWSIGLIFWISAHFSLQHEFEWSHFAFAWIIAGNLLAAFGTCDVTRDHVCEISDPDEGDKYIARAKKQALRVSLPLVLFYDFPRGIWWTIKNTPNGIHLMNRFFREVFIWIHSERRLICGVDAMLGSVIGYAAGSAIIGAVAGAVFGLVNYEIVTRRWLIPRGFIHRS